MRNSLNNSLVSDQHGREVRNRCKKGLGDLSGSLISRGRARGDPSLGPCAWYRMNTLI